MIKLPKLVLTDIDGVWTDGGMYYSTNGDEFKKFNTYDSAGVLFCHALKIPVGIITGEKSLAVEHRAKKLQIDYCYTGVNNKVEVATKICHQLKISLEEVAFIGDDLNDINLLKLVGYPGVVNSAPEYIKQYAKYITKRSGGKGAFREFVEHILIQNNSFDKAMKSINIDL
ncbi:MAG TPA: HAD-IIIA family hydrolase [Bacteroidales bacterium]|mgnify:CR=1 FL=1|nr:HAD-IIIA family hydrolase [Bacteroidales bacterium]